MIVMYVVLEYDNGSLMLHLLYMWANRPVLAYLVPTTLYQSPKMRQPNFGVFPYQSYEEQL